MTVAEQKLLLPFALAAAEAAPDANQEGGR
jgi:hypothetical protein